jgi:hypothetical protein
MALFGKQKRGTSPILLVPKPTVGGKILKPKPIEEKKK